MTPHREPRDFSVLLETCDVGQPVRCVLGRVAGIQPGHVIETRWRGQPERHRIRSISRDLEHGTWCATVTPAPNLSVVPGA